MRISKKRRNDWTKQNDVRDPTEGVKGFRTEEGGISADRYNKRRNGKERKLGQE
jgi:hypothetical protein